MFKEVILICSNISIVQEILLQTGPYRMNGMYFSWSFVKCVVTQDLFWEISVSLI